MIGPIKGNHLTKKRYGEILKVREQRFKHHTPYLLDKSEENIDFSKHCEHFICMRNGKILGSVRFTDFPFEFGLELDERLQKKYTHKYKEISRLVTIGNGQISKPLLTYSALYYIKRRQMEGFIAVCKAPRLRLFKKFGMKVIRSSVSLKSRNSHDYNMITATFDELTKSHFFYVLNNTINKSMRPFSLATKSWILNGQRNKKTS